MGRVALLIGITAHIDARLAKLSKSCADVEALGQVLEDPARGAFDSVQRLMDCTKSEAEKAISKLGKHRSSDDLILLYFSGHGIRDSQNSLYFAVSDTESDDLLGTGLGAQWMIMVLERTSSRRQIVILDCCHSGAFLPGSKSGGVGQVAGTIAEFSGIGYGRAVLTATDSFQHAFEGPTIVGTAEQSVFTRHIVEGIRTGSADLGGDGEIDVEELYRYVYDRVVLETPNQKPQHSAPREGTLWIAKAPLRPQQLPKAYFEAVQSPIADVRLSIVQHIETLLSSGSASMKITAYETLLGLAKDDSAKVSREAANALQRYPRPPGSRDETSAATELSAVPILPQPDDAPNSPVAESVEAETTSGLESDRLQSLPQPTLEGRLPGLEEVLAGEGDQTEFLINEEGSREEFRLGSIPLSLLDKIADLDPGNTYDPTPTAAQNVRMLKTGLVRDLEALLNSVAPVAVRQELESSIVAFGLPELSAYDLASHSDLHRLQRVIQKAIERFEPRLRRATVSLLQSEPEQSWPRFLVEGFVPLETGPAVVRLTLSLQPYGSRGQLRWDV